MKKNFQQKNTVLNKSYGFSTLRGWKKQVNFPSYSWYGATCQLKDRDRRLSLPQQSFPMCTLKYWIIFSFHRHKISLLTINLVSVRRGFKLFFQIRHLKLMSWPTNTPNLNPFEKVWCIFLKMVRERGLSTKKSICNCHSGKLEPLWWRILFSISEMHVQKN